MDALDAITGPDLVQRDSALSNRHAWIPYGSEGWGFESLRAR